MRLVIQGHADILSWVLMPNHMHLLLRLDNVQELPSIVGRINSCVARAANRARPKPKGLSVLEYYELG